MFDFFKCLTSFVISLRLENIQWWKTCSQHLCRTWMHLFFWYAMRPRKVQCKQKTFEDTLNYFLVGHESDSTRVDSWICNSWKIMGIWVGRVELIWNSSHKLHFRLELCTSFKLKSVSLCFHSIKWAPKRLYFRWSLSHKNPGPRLDVFISRFRYKLDLFNKPITWLSGKSKVGVDSWKNNCKNRVKLQLNATWLMKQ